MHKSPRGGGQGRSVVAFADNFKTGTLFDLPILRPEDLLNFDFDTVVIASVAAAAIRSKLLSLGIPNGKISSSYVEISAAGRDTFLKNVSREIIRKKLDGAVAEAGVFQGDFASLINKYFSNKKLYLFDTFEGFDARDLANEEGYKHESGDHFKETSVELVMSKMAHPENVIVKKGYVPETFEDVNEKFCFVNLDMDLYQPTYVALEWFWPNMVTNGVILVHDYFYESGQFPNLKKAVIKFAEENDVKTMPIGDDLSIALIK